VDRREEKNEVEMRERER
jgi:hypothetical protein